MAKKKKKEELDREYAELSPLSKEFMEKELQALTDEMIKAANDVVDDYEDEPSELEGNTFQIDAESPFLDDRFEGDKWKNFVHPAALQDEKFLEMLRNIKKKKKNKKK
tara:strand:- start:544 stop:867 length:324 start_codon:yes stop_codon:yes gene_type:complete